MTAPGERTVRVKTAVRRDHRIATVTMIDRVAMIDLAVAIDRAVMIEEAAR